MCRGCKNLYKDTSIRNKRRQQKEYHPALVWGLSKKQHTKRTSIQALKNIKKDDFFSEKRKTSRVKKGEYTQTNKKQSKKGGCTLTNKKTE